MPNIIICRRGIINNFNWKLPREVKYWGKNIEAVTAAKIHIVNENPRKVVNPRTPIASEIKNRIRKGPDLAIFPVKM
jgi:hypothetical protein